MYCNEFLIPTLWLIMFVLVLVLIHGHCVSLIAELLMGVGHDLPSPPDHLYMHLEDAVKSVDTLYFSEIQ